MDGDTDENTRIKQTKIKLKNDKKKVIIKTNNNIRLRNGPQTG